VAIFRQRADGSGVAERLTKAAAGSRHTPQAWSRDGAHMLVMVEKNSAFELDVLALADKTLTVFGDVRGTQPTEAVFSPDGRWVLYQTTSDDRRQALSSRSRGRAPSIWFRWKFLAIHSGSRKIIA